MDGRSTDDYSKINGPINVLELMFLDLMFLDLMFLGVALAYPVVAEVVGEIEDLDIGVAEFAEARERGTDVGTAIPGTASAVEDDVLVFRHAEYSLFKELEPLGAGAGTAVL